MTLSDSTYFSLREAAGLRFITYIFITCFHTVFSPRLSSCNLTERSCGALSSILRTQSCSLRELDLNNNDLQDSGVQLLSTTLQSPHCRLETLQVDIYGCLITEKGCRSLASALTSNPSHLKELDLSYNHPGITGLTLLTGLQNSQSKLDTLRYDEIFVCLGHTRG
uniref:SPRY-associated domain-containing protein n=1 Tax=Labrus bergylta TaxID=56723 RepID=A0A3Q3H3Y4_9LABR